MGADMHMAENNFRARKPKGVWDGDDLVVSIDEFPDGYKEVYRGPVTMETATLLAAFGVKVKPKPTRKLPRFFGSMVAITNDDGVPFEYAVQGDNGQWYWIDYACPIDVTELAVAPWEEL